MRNKHPAFCSDLSIQNMMLFITFEQTLQNSNLLFSYTVSCSTHYNGRHNIMQKTCYEKNHKCKTVNGEELCWNSCKTYRWGDLCAVKSCPPSTKLPWRTLVKLKQWMSGTGKSVRWLIHFISSFLLLSLFCTCTLGCPHLPLFHPKQQVFRKRMDHSCQIFWFLKSGWGPLEISNGPVLPTHTCWVCIENIFHNFTISTCMSIEITT